MAAWDAPDRRVMDRPLMEIRFFEPPGLEIIKRNRVRYFSNYMDEPLKINSQKTPPDGGASFHLWLLI
jgi:hypothetical protein